MAEIFVAKSSDVNDGERRIGVFHQHGTYSGYGNDGGNAARLFRLSALRSRAASADRAPDVPATNSIAAQEKSGEMA